MTGWSHEKTEIFIQWKGTTVCLDFHCVCGKDSHFDGDFAYGLRCVWCQRVFTMPQILTLAEGWPDNGLIENTAKEFEDLTAEEFEADQKKGAG
jgi:hypothetical protein